MDRVGLSIVRSNFRISFFRVQNESLSNKSKGQSPNEQIQPIEQIHNAKYKSFHLEQNWEAI